MLVVALEVEDRLPALGLVGAVDLLHRRVHLRLQRLIAGNGAAAGRRELHEHEALAILGEALEEAAQGAEALGQALGVVEPLHPDPEELGGGVEAREQLLARRGGRVVHEAGSHADRKRLHRRDVLAAGDREALPVDAGLDRALHRVQKVVAVVLGVEADDVGPQHPQQQIVLPRADREGLEVRPRDVPEDGGARIGALALDETRQQREVVVLDQHHGRLGARDLLEDRGRELLVDRAVLRPVLRPEERTVVHDVAERPQPLVREAVVVARLLFGGEPDPLQGEARVVRRHPQATARVRGLSVRVAAGLRHPHPSARPHDRIHRGDQAAGRRHHVDLALLPDVTDRLAVRHHHQRPLAEPHLGELLEALLGPQGLADQAQRGLLLRGGACPLEVLGQHRDLPGDGPEEALVRQLGRLDRVAAPHRLGPARHLGERLGQAHAHDQQRDEGKGNREHHEPDGVQTPQLPLRGLEVARVQEDHQRAGRLVLAQDGIGVDVAHRAADLAEAGLDRPRGERPGRFGRRILELLGHVRRRHDEGRHAVIDRQPQVRLAELLDQPVDLRLADPWAERGLEHLLEALAHEGGPPVELPGQPLPILDELEVREGPDHQEGAEPQSRDEPELELHTRLPAVAPSASAPSSSRTSPTSRSR